MKTSEKVNNEMMSNEEVLKENKDLKQGLSEEDLENVAGGRGIPIRKNCSKVIKR